MNMLARNVRVLNDSLKQRVVQGVVRDHRVDLCCLIETRIKEAQFGG